MNKQQESCEHVHKDAPEGSLCEDCYYEELGNNAEEKDLEYNEDGPY